MNSTLSLVETIYYVYGDLKAIRLVCSLLLDRQPFYNFDIIIYLFLLLFFFFHYHFGVSDGIVFFVLRLLRRKQLAKTVGK